MFDLAQREVERLIEETTYPNFLRSDVYLQYVRYCQCAEVSLGCQRRPVHDDGHEDAAAEERDCPSSPEEPSIFCASSLLPTLHEDSE
jgi:hypothetical protein